MRTIVHDHGASALLEEDPITRSVSRKVELVVVVCQEGNIKCELRAKSKALLFLGAAAAAADGKDDY